MCNQFFASVSLAAVIIPGVAFAQETTAQIRGIVTSAGAPISGAAVTATDVNSGTRSQTTTGADGSYTLPGLRVGGPYNVEVTSPAGSKIVTDIFTVVQQAYSLPIELAVEGDNTEIVVTASTISRAGVTSDGPQTVLTQQDIRKVASVNRDVRDVQRRDPFAAIDLGNAGDRGGAVSFAGVNPRFNRFTINGVTVGDTFGLNQDASPTNRGPVPFDALAQVSVSIAPYDFRQSGFQGGAIDTVLLSGTNEYRGTGFYSQNTDGLSGTRAGDSTIVTPKYKSETYGVTLSGPIIKDKVFLMVSGERNVDPRPFSTLIAQVPGLTQGIVDNIVGIAQTRYNIDAGEILTINDRRDEKFAVKLDWNVMDGQRLSVSYINAFDVLTSQNNTSTSSSTPRYGLSTNAYALTELLRAGIVQLNSDWSDRFSTEVRGIYKWTKRGQEPLGGRPNGQLQVCNDATSVGSTTGCSTGSPSVTFGPDNFRQTNQLFFDTWGGSFLGRYRAGAHDIKALIEVNQNRTFNNFVPNSLGSFYFDSLADFNAGRANSVQYAAVTDGSANGAAADFNYTQYAVGLQDDWQVFDTLSLSYGARLAMYSMKAAPKLNPFFTERYGFPNTYTYKGQVVFEPRISFNWKPDSPLKLRGGVGIFAGGSPDIYLSNSFSNTITTSAITITRSASGADTCLNSVPAAVCLAALNNVTGNVPIAVTNFAVASTGASQLARTNTGAIGQDFRIPTSLKATLSADYKLFGIDLGADYYYSKTVNGVVFNDARSQVVGVLPDGRPRYNGVNGFADSNFDIVVANSKRGRSHVGVIRASKDFDFGLSLFGSYTRQDVKDVGNATSSTINSNYRFQIFADPNNPAFGTSADQTKWSFKYGVGFDKALFGDYRTVVQFFGETQAGRPYSYTMLDNTGNRSSVFGTVLSGSSGTNLLYVPTGLSDPLIAYGDATTAAALDSFISGSALNKFRGSIAPKNIARNRAFTRIDLHLEQEIPTFLGRSRITLFGDISNLPNLLNRKWGTLRGVGFPYSSTLVSVQCANAAGTPLTGAIGSATNPTAGCARYVYSNFRAPNESLNVTQSLYAIRLGVRFTF